MSANSDLLAGKVAIITGGSRGLGAAAAQLVVARGGSVVIADLLEDDDAFFAANGLILRNTSIFNFYDLPALSLPAPRAATDLPVGIMLVGQRMQDRQVLAMAAAIEQSLQK